MDVVKLGKKGRVSIPKRLLDEFGLEGGSLLIVDTSADGAIVVRPAAAFPVEIYSDERIEEFLAEDRMSPELAERVRAKRTESSQS